MGTWGAGLLSDDTALDVRDTYREYLAEGMDGPAATDKILADFCSTVDDSDDGPPFWLALAATQWRYGRLEDRVRDRALAIIDQGVDLARFADQPRLQRARSQTLKKLREQLCSPQRRAVTVRPEVPLECDWEPGQIVGFKRDSGEWLTFHVQGIVTERRSRYPVVCVLQMPFERWNEVTPETPIRELKQQIRFGPCPDCFHIIGMKMRDLKSDRIRKTDKFIAPRVEVNGVLIGAIALLWKDLDSHLSRFL
jgi:hypothetical protein